jgi:8-oxo-dGTP diphosphatase
MTDDKLGYRFHHIQKNIILSLAQRSPLRFKDLQPPRIPNNTFSYHLKKLVDSKHIEQTDTGYMPTRKALKLVTDNTYQQKTKSAPRTISIIYITNSDGEILLLNRGRQPFQGWYGLPSGLIHLGETLQEAVKRELFDKTMIVATQDLAPRGVLDFKYVEKDSQDIFVHAIAFLYGFEYEGKRSKLNDLTTKYGQLTWSKLGRKHILPEVFAVDELMQAGEFTHKSVVFEEPDNFVVFDEHTVKQRSVNLPSL